jgi:phosphatidylinositol-3-phosphatase
MRLPPLLAVCALALTFVQPVAVRAQYAADRAIPHYRHVFVIMGENKSWERIDGGTNAPTLTRLAREYGDATRFYGEVHPSEANYVALIGGSTFGIHDDDAYYCTPGSTRPSCGGASAAGYATHAINAPHLGTQLEAHGLTWKNYEQSIPAAGSLAVYGSNPAEDGPNAPPYYASKHSGFINFVSVQNDPHRAEHLVGYDALRRDLAADTLPNFGFIIPNLCDDMHGMAPGPGVPDDCTYFHLDALIQRGDAAIGKVVAMIQASKAWSSPDNVAIVVTFDEDDGTGRAGCCGVTPQAASNFGGGHIATIVITNHGPRGVRDDTPYNHYSLLRTIEDAFGINDHLGLAAATEKGVVPMVPLFRATR